MLTLETTVGLLVSRRCVAFPPMLVAKSRARSRKVKLDRRAMLFVAHEMFDGKESEVRLSTRLSIQLNPFQTTDCVRLRTVRYRYRIIKSYGRASQECLQYYLPYRRYLLFISYSCMNTFCVIGRYHSSVFQVPATYM